MGRAGEISLPVLAQSPMSTSEHLPNEEQVSQAMSPVVARATTGLNRIDRVCSASFSTTISSAYL